MTLLHPGDKFPALTVALPGGDSLQLPDVLNGHYGVVLFYRVRGVPTATPSSAPSSGPGNAA